MTVSETNELETLRAELSFYKEMSLANSVNAFGWMRQHDKLLGFIQDRPDALKALLEDDPRGSAPSMADVPALEAEVARLTAALSDQAGGWQDISTAPKDGTRILATGGGLGNEVEIVNYNERVGCWDAPNDTLDDCDDEPQGYSRPTHWQPLPAPPPSSTAGEVG